MRRVLLKVFFCVVFSLCLFCTAFAVEEEFSEVEVGWALLNGNYNFRSEPSTSSSIIAVIPKGTIVPVYETGGWYRVYYDGQFGYLATSTFLVYTVGHYLNEETTMVSSCTEDSYKFSYCVFCDWEQMETIPAPGHAYKEVSLIEPTYHSTGTQTMECERCGHREYISIPVLIDDGLSVDVFSLGQAFLSGTWKLFGVYVPGFGFTFGGMLIGIALVGLSLSVINMVFGFGRRGAGVSARSGSSNKPKISKERSNDEF